LYRVAAPPNPPIVPQVAAPTIAAWFFVITPVQLDKNNPAALSTSSLFFSISALPLILARNFA
jgi:hypothetical protein